VQDETGDLGSERANALVVARLAGHVREEVGEPACGQAQEAALVRAVEEDLGGGEAHELRIGDLRRPPAAASLGQEIVAEYIKCGEQGVEAGWHAASLVSVALATPDFDVFTTDPRQTVAGNSESTI
jgi:hypothetical protein